MNNPDSQYNFVFDRAKIGILLCDPSSKKIIKVNKALCNLLGYPEDEFKRMNLTAIVPDPLLEEHEMTFELIKKEGEITFETDRLNKKGALVPVEINASYTQDNKGNPIMLAFIRGLENKLLTEQIKEISYLLASKINDINLKLKDLCKCIHEQLALKLDAENFFMAIKTGPEEITYVYNSDHFNKEKTPFVRKKGKGLSELVIESNESILLVGKEGMAFQQASQLETYGVPAKSWLGAPIKSGGTTIGVIACQSYTDFNAFSETNRQFLTLLGRELGVYIERVKNREERNKILNLSKDLICIVEENGYLKYVNPAFTRLLGYSEKELLSQPITNFLHPDDQLFDLEEMKLHTESDKYQNIENRLIQKSGGEKRFSWTVAVIPEEKSFYCMGRDITEESIIHNELKESERRYRNLFESMHDGIIMTDESGIITQLNFRFSQIAGYTVGELTGKKAADILIDKRTYDELFAGYEKSEITYREKEIQITHKSGRKIWVSLSTYALFSDTGSYIGMMSVFTDIVKRKQMQEQREGAYFLLKKSEERLRKENREVLKYQSLLLSSQINPHFIFNALNSIQYHILDNNPQPTLEFVANFANLMRMVMQNSEKSYISLEEELNFLKDYLTLEKGRHNNKFDFNIEVTGDVLPESTLIPPMLLQPYVENAIIHGVNHLAKDGLINILIKKKNDDFLICEIVDNGLGIQEAQRRNLLKEGVKNPNSSSVNRSRIDILNAIGEVGKFEFEIEDVWELGVAEQGTKVILTFPCITEE